MNWIIVAILSAVFAGLTSILAKCGIKKTDSDVATALRTVVVLVFSWVMVFIVGSYTDLHGYNSIEMENGCRPAIGRHPLLSCGYCRYSRKIQPENRIFRERKFCRQPNAISTQEPYGSAMTPLETDSPVR